MIPVFRVGSRRCSAFALFSLCVPSSAWRALLKISEMKPPNLHQTTATSMPELLQGLDSREPGKLAFRLHVCASRARPKSCTTKLCTDGGTDTSSKRKNNWTKL